MHNLIAIFFPLQPSGLYLILRSILVMGICLFFLTQAANTWIESALKIPPFHSSNPTRLHMDDPKVSTSQGIDQNNSINTRAIIDRNIFGGSAVEPKKETKDETIQLDQIPLAENLKEFQLIGTIIGSETNNWAVFENKRKRDQQLMTVGDMIKDIRIKKILRNNVIVNDGKQDQVLSIDYQVRSRLQESSLAEADSRPSPEQGTVVNIERENVQKALNDFNSLLQDVRISPYLEQGQSIGMQVSNIKDGSFFDSLHLKNGDVLVGTDASQLNSPQGFLNLTQEMKKTDHVRLHIKRNSQNMTLLYKLK